MYVCMYATREGNMTHLHHINIEHYSCIKHHFYLIFLACSAGKSADGFGHTVESLLPIHAYSSVT